MFEKGSYAAWFKTPLKQGTGIAHLADGKISGGDSIMSYSGTYEVCGDRFTAVVVTARHSEGHETVFGVDNLTLRLEGRFAGKVARYVARADGFPDMILEGTLIRSEQDLPRPDRVVPPFDPEKLPKLPTRSR